MLQRLQSILLAIAALLGLGTLVVPAWTYSYQAESESVTALQMYSLLDHGTFRQRWFFLTPEHILWFSATVLVSLFLIFIIFQYKNRTRQILFCHIAMVGIGVQILALMLLVTNHGPQWILGGAKTGSPFIGFGMIIADMILVWWASKRIKKDDNLVKSMDRLR
jgi:hypothetical protein